MIAEPFATGDTWLHRLDSRVKLVVGAAFAIVVAVAHSPGVLPAAWIGAALLLASARPPLRPLATRLAALNIFIVLLWVMLPLTSPGPVVGRLGPLVFHADGVRLAWQITLKANAILLAMTALVATSTIFNVAHALVHLRVPGKLAQLFFFTWRFLHDVAAEFARLRRAMKVRCFSPRTSLHTYRTYAYLLGTLMVRGFTGTLPAYRHPQLRPVDAVAAALFLAAVCLLGAWEWQSSIQL